MRRLLFHLLFWLAYFAFRGFIEYLWLHGSLKGFSETDYVVAAWLAAFLEGLPEVLYAYYLTYRVWPRLEKGGVMRWWILVEAMVLLLSAIYMVRIIFYYIVADQIYKGLFPSSEHFEFRRFMAILFNFLATSGLMVAVKSIRQQLELKEKQKNLVKEKLETELKMLRSQINPHFLFNTLNNIYGLSIRKSDKAPEAVMKLSELLHFTLYRAGAATIALEEELQIIKDYISLEKLRYDERLEVNWEQHIDDPQQAITPLILLPLIENAFKHGAGNSRFQAFVHIKVNLEYGVLYFNISNSFEKNEQEKVQKERIGLHNTRRQLELTYQEYELDIYQQDQVFSVELTINLNSYGTA
jgi:sensor histidine kinase YesM